MHTTSSLPNQASLIWHRRSLEYGSQLDIEYAESNSQFQNFRKSDGVSMEAHISSFSKYLQEVECSKPSGIAPLTQKAINLKFLTSLSRNWEVFGMAKGDNIRQMTTAALFAEVCAIDARKMSYSVASQPQPSSTPSTHALVTNFQNNRRNQGCGSRNNSRSGHGNRQKQGRGSSNRRGNDRNSSFDPNKYCRHCQIVGHDVYICRKFGAISKRQDRLESGNNGGGGGNRNQRWRQVV